MALSGEYAAREPERAEVDALAGPTLLEFGSPWCGYCLRHVRIADASGRRLGRSFRVKLWPTLVFLFDGGERSRLIRPADAGSIADALKKIDS